MTRYTCTLPVDGTVIMTRCDYPDPAQARAGVRHSGRGTTPGRVGYKTQIRPEPSHFRQIA